MFINEFVKNFRVKYVVIIIILLILINIFSILLMDRSNISNWISNAKIQRQSYTEALTECLEKGVEQKYYEVFEEKILLIDYSLKHNIPYGVADAAKHSIRMTELFVFFQIVLIFILGSVLVKEYESNTWKNLLMTGVNRGSLLLTKVLFCYIYCIILVLIYFVINLICGIIAFDGRLLNINIGIENGVIVENNPILELIFLYLTFLLKQLFYVSISIMLIIISKGKLISMVLPSLLVLGVNPIASSMKEFYLNKILPFKYLASSNANDLTQAFLMFAILGIYSLIFFCIGRVIFEKSDLVS